MNLKIFGKEIFIKRTTLAAICVCLIVAAGISGVFIVKNDKYIVFENIEAGEDNDVISTAPETDAISSFKPSPDETHDDEIRIYMTGCVKNPGLVTLKKGQLIDDALKAAGGPTDDADLNFNLAYVLNENAWIVVKSKKENTMTANNKADENTDTKKDVRKSDAIGEGVEIRKDSGGVVIAGDGADDSNENSKININTATADKLINLPGIGEKIAADIIAYREKNGKFKTIGDIVKVPGIGEGKFNKVKDLITVD